MFRAISILILVLLFSTKLFAETQIIYTHIVLPDGTVLTVIPMGPANIIPDTDDRVAGPPAPPTVNIHFNPDGKVQVSGSITSEMARDYERALQNLNFQNASLDQARALILNRLSSPLYNSSSNDFNSIPSLENPFYKKQFEDNAEFEKSISKNIYHPQFKSTFLNKDIEFDAKKPDDKRALKTYIKAQQQISAEFSETEKFKEGVFAKQIIETRQSNTQALPRDELNALTQISEGMLSNNSNAVLEAMNLLFKSSDFQKGFATSIANNFNPVSFAYPLEMECENDWCKTGKIVGDATALLIGTYEFMKGATMMLGGSGLTLAAVAAVPETAGLSASAIPATAGATLAGIAMAGHGLSTMAAAFKNLFNSIDTPTNTKALSDSRIVIESASKLGVKEVDEISAASQLLKKSSASASEIEGLIERNASVFKGWRKNHEIIDVHDASKINQNFKFKGWEEPYEVGTKVFEFKPKIDDKFVRVYGPSSKPDGRWVMKSDAIKGLTPQQIQQKYSLPKVPESIVDVEVPAGTRMYRGKIKANFNGNEGAVQYQIIEDSLEKIKYTNERQINGVEQ